MILQTIIYLLIGNFLDARLSSFGYFVLKRLFCAFGNGTLFYLHDFLFFLPDFAHSCIYWVISMIDTLSIMVVGIFLSISLTYWLSLTFDYVIPLFLAFVTLVNFLNSIINFNFFWNFRDFEGNYMHVWINLSFSWLFF